MREWPRDDDGTNLWLRDFALHSEIANDGDLYWILVGEKLLDPPTSLVDDGDHPGLRQEEELQLLRLVVGRQVASGETVEVELRDGVDLEALRAMRMKWVVPGYERDWMMRWWCPGSFDIWDGYAEHMGWP